MKKNHLQAVVGQISNPERKIMLRFYIWLTGRVPVP